MGTRRKARILAFQTLYRYDISETALADLLDFSWYGEERLARLGEDIIAFAQLIIAGAIEHIGTIDDAIKEHLQHWDFSRLSRVDLAILRMSGYCLLFQKDIPPSVTIDEAIHIAKEFSSDEAYKFINGILDGMIKKI
ncbi:MAG: transcription antitermination factor NusB [Spirochaetales bacterium]|nr:transcription antitermination factor NusB [Spirochaetales bacterium]